MDKEFSPDLPNKKTKSNNLGIAAISSIIGLLLFLFSYASMLSAESGVKCILMETFGVVWIASFT